MPDTYADATATCKVIEKGNKVSPFIKKGDLVLCQNLFGDRKNSDSSTFFCREHNIFGIIKNRLIHPVGRNVLIRRDVQEDNVNGIIIPENRRTQSLFGTIVRLGFTNKIFRVDGLKVGDRIRLTQWESHMVELNLEDGSYGLIVNENDILYKEETP